MPFGTKMHFNQTLTCIIHTFSNLISGPFRYAHLVSLVLVLVGNVVEILLELDLELDRTVT